MMRKDPQPPLADKASWENEESYRVLFKKNPLPMWVFDSETFKFLAVNEATLEQYGYSEEEFRDLTVNDVRTANDVDPLMKSIDNSPPGLFRAGRWKHKRKDGSLFDVEVTAYRTVFCGRPAVLVLLENVTEQIRAEELLRKQARLSSFTAEIGMALTSDVPIKSMLQMCAEAITGQLGAADARIWLLDKKNGVLQLEACAGAWSLRPIGHNIQIGVGPIGLIAELRKQDRSDSVPEYLQECDPQWAEKSGKAGFAGFPLSIGEQLIGVMAVYSNETITDDVARILEGLSHQIALQVNKEWTEEALLSSERQYRELFEESRDVVFLSTPDGSLIDINSAGVELFGYASKEELLLANVGRDLYANPHDRLTVKQMMLDKGYVKDHELVLRRRDGEKLIVLETATAVKDENGNVIGYRGFLRDVSHLKDLQQQLLQSQKMEAIGKLAGGVAHDFNNTLMAITGYSELLLMKMTPNHPFRRLVLEIEKASNQGASLTRQLLAFSRKQVLTPRVLNLNHSISNLHPMLERLIGEDIELVTALSGALSSVEIDPGQMEQVVMNLVINARDAMPRGGKLTIETSNVELDENYAGRHVDLTPGPYVMLGISDTGCGMDEATLRRIYEPFFTTKGEGKGTGLGLSTVYGIVKQSGGHIFAYSQPNQGATFKIYLPCVLKSGVIHEETRVSSDPELSVHGETILLVDDNEPVRRAVAAFLEMTGFHVFQAAQGTQALEIIQKGEDIDLMISDIVMPGMSGLELAMKVRTFRPRVKILYMSGYTEEAIRSQGSLDADAGFLSKPATMQSLLSKIRELFVVPA